MAEHPLAVQSGIPSLAALRIKPNEFADLMGLIDSQDDFYLKSESINQICMLPTMLLTVLACVCPLFIARLHLSGRYYNIDRCMDRATLGGWKMWALFDSPIRHHRPLQLQ